MTRRPLVRQYGDEAANYQWCGFRVDDMVDLAATGNGFVG